MGDDDDGEVTEYVKVGDRVPAFSVETVLADGSTATFSTAQLTGETVIVLFNTSCGDCQRELPRMNDYYLQHCGDKGFQMVAISREEGAESVAAYWKEQGLSIPYSAQTDRRIYNLFASSIIPRTYFCSADGIITQILVETFF
jgi:peroxiredoxin